MVSSAFRPPAAYRDMSSGEMIADGAVHAAALVAGVIGFSVLFQKVALRGAASDGVAMAIPPPASFCCSAFPAPTTCAALAGEMAAATLRSRLDLSDDRRHLYRAVVSGRHRILDVALSATVWTGALAGASLKRSCPAGSTASRSASISASAGRR